MMKNELTFPLPGLIIDHHYGLRNLIIEDCGQINLVVGTNNCGKTTLLNYIFDVHKRSSFPVVQVFLPPIAGGPRLNPRSPQEAAKIAELLAIADPDITGLDERLYVHHKKSGFAASHQLGTGINRLLQIAIGIARAEDGVLLIDDIEFGLGCDRLNEIFDWIVRWAKKHNTQIFAVTHSHHLVDALVRATESDSDLVLHRLESVESGTLVIRHGRDRLERLREMGQNVLGWVRSL